MNRKIFLKMSMSGIIIGFLFGMIGCAHNLLTYNGRIVKPENRIPFTEGGPHTSVWKTEDLTLNYQYRKQADTLEISGTVSFANHLVYNYRDFTNFMLTVYFMDMDGRILGDSNLASAGVGKPIGEMSFSQRRTLPQGTSGMVFGYQGRAVDMSGGDAFGNNGGIDWQFWKTPTR